MADRNFNSQVDLKTATDEHLLGCSSTTFVSIGGDVILSIEDTPITSMPDIVTINAFSSTANITNTTVSDIGIAIFFNSVSNCVANTISDIDFFVAFNSVSNIQTSIDNASIDYKIGGYKKLEYLTNSFTPKHVEHFNPKFKDLIRVFLRYLDYFPMFKTLTLEKNNNLNTIFPEFIDYYLDQYLNNTIDLSKYQLTENNKKLLLLLSRLINNSKGTQKAFSYLFRSLTNIRIANEDIQISVDKIVTEFIENESWWSGGTIKYYDDTYTYDGSVDHEADFAKPFTYQFKIDQSLDTMLPLIKSVHPAGFQQEFLLEMNFEDDLNSDDELNTTITYYHFYCSKLDTVLGASPDIAVGIGGDDSLGIISSQTSETKYYHDGSIDYSGSHQVIEIT